MGSSPQELRLLGDIDDILIKYSSWKDNDQWFLRVRFVTSLTDVMSGEPGRPTRVGPNITQHTHRALDLIPFTDQDIRCTRQLFFLLLADALSGEALHEWTATELDATGTDWAYSWAHADPHETLRNSAIYTFFSDTPPAGSPMARKVPATWFFKKTRCNSA
jgi:hypothetical protein